MPRLGAHVSVAGGLHKAFERGHKIGCDSLQIFVKNPNCWQTKPLSPEDVEQFRTACQSYAEMPVVAHAAYLINLCAAQPETLYRSRAALADELLRCSELGVPSLIVHPGSHMGQGEEKGLERVAASIDEVIAKHPGLSTQLLLENTAGQGSALGYRFEQLARIFALVDQPERLGVCLDSCHAFAAGYELHDEKGYEAMLAEFDETIGLEHLRCLHLNDAKQPLGSQRDRHANISQGEIGTAFFSRLIHDARFETLPMILETPLGDDEKGHERDLKTLRALKAAEATRAARATRA